MTAERVVASTAVDAAETTRDVHPVEIEKAGVEKSATERSALAAPVLAHDKRRALGRGLESLLPGPRPTGGAAAGTGFAGTAAAPGVAAGAGDGEAAGAVPGVIAELHGQAARRAPDSHDVIELAIERIEANPHQTRSFTQREMDTLKELTDSIKVHGVIQPVTVRPGKDGKYVLITGERRMRASTMAGKATIPAIVRVVSEQQAAEMTVIENLQRQDLTCIDLARAFIMLSKDFGLTQEQIGERVGSSRESVSNHMRLAKLPESVQIYLREGQLEFSHARLLLNLGDPEVINKMAYKVVMDQISVEKLEDMVFDQRHPIEGQKKVSRGARWVDPNVKAAQRKMEEILGVKVKIRDRNGKGKITMEYSTLGDFDRILEMLTKKANVRS
jgi:ParB family chromosome partitioning protein